MKDCCNREWQATLEDVEGEGDDFQGDALFNQEPSTGVECI